MTDIEIARNSKLLKITDVAKKISIPEDALEQYGNYKAKIDFSKIKNKPLGKVVLVTAINPTSAGEGKTTVSIGLNDALCKLNYKSVLALREPSLGPVFGIKGGATGGGYAQVAPMEDINLHFTGDFHAITSANNLLSSLIDNHIFQGNEANLDPNNIVFNRCLDLNDRALREVTVRSSAKGKETIERNERFNITAASEIMAIMCLSKDIDDLKENLGNITIGYTYDNKPVYAKDIKANEAMTILLKDAIKPNLVQTLENNPAIVHCGPFANIAHGCNSIIATDLARRLSDIVVTEAGFGADLGAEKFLDIKCRKMNLKPSCVVLVATVRALKLHGNELKENLSTHDVEMKALKLGLSNLEKHINNLKDVYKLKPVVAINKFTDDADYEIDLIKTFAENLGVNAIPINVWGEGGNGALNLAKEVKQILDEDKNEFTYSYDVNDTIKNKINDVCKKIYGARSVILTDKAKQDIKTITESGYDKLPICIAKTQYSLSDDPKKLLITEPFDITIRGIEVRTGAKMLVCLAGDMLLMPGLSKEPSAIKMKINNNIIEGLF